MEITVEHIGKRFLFPDESVNEFIGFNRSGDLLFYNNLFVETWAAIEIEAMGLEEV